jgi:hypothetical protein
MLTSLQLKRKQNNADELNVLYRAVYHIAYFNSKNSRGCDVSYCNVVSTGVFRLQHNLHHCITKLAWNVLLDRKRLHSAEQYHQTCLELLLDRKRLHSAKQYHRAIVFIRLASDLL